MQYSPYGLIILFVIQIIALYIASSYTTKTMFHALHVFIKKDKLIFLIVSMIYFPGTILHELAHYLTALALMMKVRDISIFPTFQKNYIRLGSVTYDRKDYIRGTLIGIAPIFAGLFFFWFIAHFRLFPGHYWYVTLIFTYLIFAVSSTMFSSKQDLIDLIHITPFIFVFFLILYVLKINIIPFFTNQYIIQGIAVFIAEVDRYLVISIVINILLIVLFKFIQKLKNT